ncbi:MAG TPA: hypothetical protein VIQ78_03790 [Terrimesophilobacter sp.]|jgi:hypothetical protein|uniref:hypothetical protein n=1 Tax=Terrimesophilobacter sp. TaxID=2906435 RepID=UPI002F93EDEA
MGLSISHLAVRPLGLAAVACLSLGLMGCAGQTLDPPGAAHPDSSHLPDSGDVSPDDHSAGHTESVDILGWNFPARIGEFELLTNADLAVLAERASCSDRVRSDSYEEHAAFVERLGDQPGHHAYYVIDRARYLSEGTCDNDDSPTVASIALREQYPTAGTDFRATAYGDAVCLSVYCYLAHDGVTAAVIVGNWDRAALNRPDTELVIGKRLQILESLFSARTS